LFVNFLKKLKAYCGNFHINDPLIFFASNSADQALFNELIHESCCIRGLLEHSFLNHINTNGRFSTTKNTEDIELRHGQVKIGHELVLDISEVIRGEPDVHDRFLLGTLEGSVQNIIDLHCTKVTTMVIFSK